MNNNTDWFYEIPIGHDYSPLYLCNLYKKMIEQENWSIEEAFNPRHNNKTIKIVLEWIEKTYTYKQVIEAHHVSIFCLAINKHYNIKNNLILSDAPDVIIVNKDNCTPVEVYEAYEFWRKDEKTIINIWEQIGKLKEKKLVKSKKYSKGTNLLIWNRVQSVHNWFNISEYTKLINESDRWFSAIRLCISNQTDDTQIFYEVYPSESREIKEINYSLSKDKAYLY